MPRIYDRPANVHTAYQDGWAWTAAREIVRDETIAWYTAALVIIAWIAKPVTRRSMLWRAPVALGLMVVLVIVWMIEAAQRELARLTGRGR